MFKKLSSKSAEDPDWWVSAHMKEYLEVVHKVMIKYTDLSTKEEDLQALKRILRITVTDPIAVDLPLIQNLFAILECNRTYIDTYVERWLPRTQTIEFPKEFAQSGLFKYSSPKTATEPTWCAVIGGIPVEGPARNLKIYSLLREVLAHPDRRSAITTLLPRDACRAHELIKQLLGKCDDRSWTEFIADSPPEFKSSSKLYYRRLASLYAELIIFRQDLPPDDLITIPVEAFEKRSYTLNPKPFYTGLTAHTVQGLHHRKPIVLKQFCIRRPEFREETSLAVANDLYKDMMTEMLVWRHLRDANIAPLYGIVHDFRPSKGPVVASITPFMQNGNIVQYIRHLRKDREPSRLEFGTWFAQIARGLAFLHREGLVHGNLHGSQILVDDKGDLRLVDFGWPKLNSLKRMLTETLPETSIPKKTTTNEIIYQGDRWMAPEVLQRTRSLYDTLSGHRGML
ncbi:hypothetical protein NM688_g6589 [Phlebia brevispora]|uniref:Uncharacterized protein n=1 Tax=Phlebia brevispora TaxID=194682 RepID=A0ACC1SEL8_9APHY|nr:hypothetical protein NM688_g6589 [Phlebia brevispora]